MKFKKFFFVTCLIICLFTIASVCAGEMDDGAMTAIDSQDDLDINDDETDIPVGEVNSLNEPQGDVEITEQENIINSNHDNLKISGNDLGVNVAAFNVSVADNTVFVIDCTDDFNGNVSIKVNEDVLYDAGVKTIIKAGNLPAGNYLATAVFYGDDNYGMVTLNNIAFSVSRLNPSIDVTIDDATYPKDVNAFVRIGNNANGTVNITVDGKTFSRNVFNGEANVGLFELSAGYKNANIEFFSSDNYNNNAAVFSKFIIYSNNSLIDITSKPTFRVGEDIEIIVNTINSTGDLTLYINGEYYNKLAHENNGKYEIAISDKLEGTYFLNFRLDGDENYTGYETSVTINVVKNDLEINVSDIDGVIYVASPVTFTAKMNRTVTGNVIFTINGANYTEYVYNADEVTHTYIPLNNETLTVTATFTGSDWYNVKASDSVNFIVTRIATYVDVNFYSPIISGDDAYITVLMNPEITCTVTVNVGSKSYDVAVVEGSGMYSVSNLANATYDIQAVFAGDDRYAGSTSEVKHLFVNKIHTNLYISIDKTSMSYNDFAVVSVVLDHSINTVVTVKVNGKNNTVGLVNGKGSFTLYDLDKDNYTINAVFAGDDRYVESVSNTLNLTVTGDNISSSVDISFNMDSVFVGDDVVITVNSNPTVTEVIKINIGSNSYNVAVNRGVGTLTISDLPNGIYDVQAIFDGDNKHSGSSSEVKQLEVKRIPTNLSISIDNSSRVVGDSAVVSVVLDQSINNVVTVNVNGKDYLIGLVNGYGNLTLNDLAFGTYNVNATFANDDKYVESTSNNVVFEVNKIKTELTGDSIVANYDVEKYLVITLKDSKGNPISNAELDVNLNGAKIVTTDKNGQVKLSTNALVPNVYSVKISFKGNAIYDKSSKELTVTVKKATPVITASKKTYKVKVKSKKYTITLKANGKVMKNARVSLKVNKKTYTVKTNAKGQATFKITNLNKKGTFGATITYKATKYYDKATKTVKIKIKK